MFPGQGLVVFKVTPYVRWRWYCIPQIRMRVDFGVSMCSPLDVYDPEYGRILAEERLHAFVNGRTNLAERRLAGTWTMDREPWLAVMDARCEREVLFGIWSENFPLILPFTWDRMVNGI